MLEELEEKLINELEEIGKFEHLDRQDIDDAFKLIDIVKDIYEVRMFIAKNNL